MTNKKDSTNAMQSRRDFVKKAAYTAPAIVTMAAMPSFASAGSSLSGGTTSVPGNRSRGPVSGNTNHK